MDEEEKPFACNFGGCNQRFSNNDHLIVHEQHHTLDIKFPGRADSFLVDQTPTPTRFLKLGDETGLFEALKGDELPKPSNPFDVGFREAALKNSQTSQSVSQPVYQVTQPVADRDRESIGTSVGTSSIEKPVMTTVKTLNSSETSQMLLQAVGLPSKTVLPSSKSSPSLPVSGIASSVGTVVIPVAPPTGLANPTADFPVASVPIGLSLANSSKVAAINGKFDLKQQIKHNLVAQNPSIVSQAIAHAQTREDTLQENVYSPTEVNKTAGRRRSRSRTEDGDPDTKRKRFLERNRAAATRCREKRKQWIVGLEKKADGMSAQNTQLQQEVLFLKNEVAQLKSLLLAHKDCPVTVAQQEQMKQLQATSTDGLPATTTLSTGQQTFFLFTKSSDMASSTPITTGAKQEHAEQVATTALATMARPNNQLLNLAKLNTTTGVN